MPIRLYQRMREMLRVSVVSGELRAPVRGVVQDGRTGDGASYRDLFESAPDGIFVADAHGTYTDVNPAGCRMLGYTREELVGRSVVEFVEPEELARQAALKGRVLAGMHEVSQWRLLRKDGTCLQAELSTNARPDGSIQAFVRDVTERQRTEHALCLSEAKFSGIVGISTDAIICIDAQQRITTFNEGAERTFGYESSEVLGAPLALLLPERFRGSHRAHVDAFAHGQRSARRMGSRPADIIGRRKDGEEFPADAAISKLEVAGTLVLTVSLRDMTEQRRSEREQRQRAELAELLVTAGPDYAALLGGVANLVVRDWEDWCAIDIVQNGDLKRAVLVHGDPTKAAVAQKLSQLPGAWRNAKPLSDAIAGLHTVVVNEIGPERLASMAVSGERLELLRAFGISALMVVPLVARGLALGSITIGSSRTTRRYDQRDIAHAEQLAHVVALALDNARLHDETVRAMHARDELLGIVAHDLRSPLNAIALQSHLLQRPARSERRSPKVPEQIRAIVVRMSQLIDDLLDVTRLEGGQTLTIKQTAVSGAGLVAEAAEQVKASVARAETLVNVEVEQGMLDVWADRGRILQVLDNLLGNALKFAVSRVSLRAAARGSEIVFSVADDGAGIPAADIPRLFDRFWQASRSDRRGAGLGLSIVKGLVDAHRGRLWVESTLGRGTTFYFTLPLASGHSAEESVTRGMALVHGSSRLSRPLPVQQPAGDVPSES